MNHDPADLLGDPGVLAPTPTLEFGGFGAAGATEGEAVLPWRADWLTAEHHAVRAHAAATGIGERRFGQCVVHLQKSRDATWSDLGRAWDHLEPGGRLLFVGGNALGVVSAVKRLAGELGQPIRVLTNRKRARIVLFLRDEGPRPASPEPSRIRVPWGDGEEAELEADAGVFSARRLDAGTELLLQALPDQKPPGRIVDLGCGIGVLGLAALRLWPEAEAWLADGDQRAIESVTRNARTLGVEDRCHIVWWDAAEPPTWPAGDLALVNPPFHSGKVVDFAPARAMFAALAPGLRPGGSALIVANRTLPYERDLRALGRLEILRETRSYKLLGVRRRASSSGSSGRKAPGARSVGSS